MFPIFLIQPSSKPDTCPSCHKEEDTALVCRHCGHEYEIEEEKAMKKPIMADHLAVETVYIAITNIRNQPEPCIMVPNGIIILKASTIEQLQLIEDSMLAYEHGDE